MRFNSHIVQSTPSVGTSHSQLRRSLITSAPLPELSLNITTCFQIFPLDFPTGNHMATPPSGGEHSFSLVLLTTNCPTTGASCGLLTQLTNLHVLCVVSVTV